jgi:transposase
MEGYGQPIDLRAGLSWPPPENLSDETLERLLYPPTLVAAKDRRAQPDWAAIHRKTRWSGVTLQLLWEEHRAGPARELLFSRYCELYRAWEGRLSSTTAATCRRRVDVRRLCRDAQQSFAHTASGASSFPAGRIMPSEENTNFDPSNRGRA